MIGTTNTANPVATEPAGPTERLVEVFATAGIEADDLGVLPDALVELARRLGGDDTLAGVALNHAAELLVVEADLATDEDDEDTR